MMGMQQRREWHHFKNHRLGAGEALARESMLAFTLTCSPGPTGT